MRRPRGSWRSAIAASSGPLSRAMAPAKIHGWGLATSRSLPGLSVRMRRLAVSKRSTAANRTTYAGKVNDTYVIWFFVVAVAVLITVLVARKSSELAERLTRLITSFGWEAPRRVWWNGALRARWRSFDVELRHIGRQKGVPERLLLIVNTASPARVIVIRRGGFMSKPMTLFGPPIVEPMNPAVREQFWIRSEELPFVERLFARAEIAPELERNLIARFDVVDLQPKQLRIVRAVDDSAVKKHFNRPFLKFGRDYELIDTIASEEWKLAVMIVETLGLRGYEAA